GQECPRHTTKTAQSTVGKDAFGLSQLQAAPGASPCAWRIVPADVRHPFECCLVFNSLEIMSYLQAISAPRIGWLRFSSFPSADDAHKANLRVAGASCAAI
ncbi:MAG: hypothetical protein WAN60_21590, partial [Candidatus Sulfotelmatobacter sp.]